MTSGWQTAALADVSNCLNRRRVPVKESDRRPGPYPYYGASGVVDYVDDYLFDGEYLLVSEDGENLQSRKTPIAFMAKGRFWVNNHAHILEGANGTFTRYLCYCLEATDIGGYLTGSAQPKLTKANLGQIPLLLPPPREQAAILAAIGALDDKIELNRKMNQTLGAMAKALFKSWFVDFDPVAAKRAGQQPFAMDAETAVLFPEHFQNSELGPIPEGWAVYGLDKLARFLNGLALQKYPADGGESLPAIKISELRSEDTSSSERTNGKIAADYVVNDGDVLFSWSGSLLATIWCGGKGALNQHLFKVTTDKYPKWFVYQWIQEHINNFRDIAADKATTMGHIRRHHLSDAKVVVPSDAVLVAADKMVGPLIQLYVANKIEVRTLAALRDLLLPGLLSGEIRVADIRNEVAVAV